MNIDSINALEEAIKTEDILKKHNLNKIGVFGSFARGEKANDIDFYIDEDDYDLNNLLALQKDLERITKMRVDILLREYANPIILYRAGKDMKYVTR